jgi:O-antigen/teichoic acid export membrane protein
MTSSPATVQTESSGSSARLLASNTAWRLLAFGARTVSGVLATVLLAHIHGPVGLGRFQFALTLTLLLSFAVALGLPKLLVRELARHPEAIKVRIESALVVSLGAGVVVTILLLGAGVLFHADTSVFVLAGLALAADSAMRIAMVPFWALERMRYEALCVGIQEGAFVVLAVVALWAGFGPGGVMLAYLVSRVIGLVTVWTVVALKLHIRLVPRWHAGEMAPMMKRATPFALDDALSLAYIRLDTVILGIIIGAHEVGLYQAAVNLVLYLNILPRMLNFSMYPRMSRAWPDNVGELRRLCDSSLMMLGALAMPIAVGSFLLAPRIFGVMYGAGFDRGVLAYLLVTPLTPIRMLGNTLGTAITAADRQTKRTIAVGVAAGVNVVLNLILIPRWGLFGAVASTIVTETGLFTAYVLMLRRVIGPSCLVSAVTIPGMACIPLALSIVSLADAPLAVVLVAASCVYALSLYAIAALMAPGRTLHPRSVVSAFVRWAPVPTT